MCTYGASNGSGKCAGGAALSQKRCWATCVGSGVGVGLASASAVSVEPADVEVPNPVGVPALDKVPAAIGADAISVEVPLPLWGLIIAEVAAVCGVGVPNPLLVVTPLAKDAAAVVLTGTTLSLWVSTLYEVVAIDRSLGREVRGTSTRLGLTTVRVSLLDTRP